MACAIEAESSNNGLSTLETRRTPELLWLWNRSPQNPASDADDQEESQRDIGLQFMLKSLGSSSLVSAEAGGSDSSSSNRHMGQQEADAKIKRYLFFKMRCQYRDINGLLASKARNLCGLLDVVSGMAAPQK